MKRFSSLHAALLAMGVALAGPASGTSTDGFHSIQIVPVVVSTGSFLSDIFVFNPNAGPISVNFRYLPAEGLPQQFNELDCGNKVIPASSVVQHSLNSLCPTLAPGSNFGMLEAIELEPTIQPFSVYVRIHNPQGQGFSVESYPPHTFTAATVHVTGLRRQTLTPGYQTNCFFGSPAEGATVTWSLLNSAGVPIGTSRTLYLSSRKLNRLLDVFAFAGAPVGDYQNARLVVNESTGNPNYFPGVVVFCTVQNNTTFDADFRIGKAMPVRDGHAARTLVQSADDTGAPFTLGTWPLNRNRHGAYFKHPDWVSCSVAATPDNTAVELRLIAPDGVTVVAGGPGQTSFPKIYLGHKSTRNAGSNGRWYIEVEGSGVASNDKPYSLSCTSGSGHSRYDLVAWDLPDAF